METLEHKSLCDQQPDVTTGGKDEEGVRKLLEDVCCTDLLREQRYSCDFNHNHIHYLMETSQL